jgi:PAS domain S-box-containing protein
MPRPSAKKPQRTQAAPRTEAPAAPLHALLEGLPDAFFMLDADWRFTYVSPGMAELLSGTATLGDDLRRASPGLLELRRHLRFEQPTTGQPTVRYEQGWPDKDLCFDVRVKPVEGGLLVHCRDITGERRAREELKRTNEVFRAILEGTTDAVYTKDLEGRYQLMNTAGAKALGLTVDQMVGRTDAELFPAEVARTNAANDREVFAFGRTVTYEDAQPGADGAPRVWLSTKGVLRDTEGKVYGLFGISRDITQRKWAEEEARRHAEFQEQLMGIVSHDIRSPLGAIMNWSRVLAQGGTAEEAQRTSQRIATAAVRIERLTRLLLDFTRTRLVGGVAIEPRPVDLNDLTEKVAHEFRVAFPQRAIEVERKGNTQGTWDPDRLAQVASNLVENALKYSPPETPVKLSAKGVRNKVVLEVHNAGRPIPANLIPHLFEPFRRGPQTARTLKMSYGLGLYIVREIVQAHGGTIEVTSGDTEGTTFTVTLPRRSMPKLPGGPPPPAVGPEF